MLRRSIDLEVYFDESGSHIIEYRKKGSQSVL